MRLSATIEASTKDAAEILQVVDAAIASTKTSKPGSPSTMASTAEVSKITWGDPFRRIGHPHGRYMAPFAAPRPVCRWRRGRPGSHRVCGAGPQLGGVREGPEPRRGS